MSWNRAHCRPFWVQLYTLAWTANRKGCCCNDSDSLQSVVTSNTLQFFCHDYFSTKIFSLTSFIRVSVQQRHSHTETRLGFIEHSWHSLSQWCHPGEWASNTGISKFLKWEMVGIDIMCTSRYWSHSSGNIKLQHFGVPPPPFFLYRGDNGELWRLCAHKSCS